MMPSQSGAAGGKLDVQRSLAHPGVKLLAVEFYATWCAPCMEAVPRWKALHAKYRKRGLRLVVVNTLDPGGQCKSVGWNPDAYVCDLDGRIARAFGVGNKLPSAFLWSWQGNQLVKRGHIDEVGKEVARYMGDNPRVLVEAFGPDNRRSAALETAVKTEIKMTGKFDVVASEQDKAKLRAIRKKSHGASRRQDQQCKVGAEVSANALMEARVMGQGDESQLAMSLHSAETGCLLASSYVAYDKDRAAMSVREVTASLLDKLRTAPELPGALGAAGGRAAAGNAGGEWTAKAKTRKVVASFKSTPAGAVVLVDGKLLCAATPCSKAVVAGRHSISMQKEGFGAKNDIVQLAKGSAINWKLARDVAYLDIETSPPSLPVRVDGAPVGTSPITNHQVKPGAHVVLVAGACVRDTRQKVQLKPGERRKVKLAARVRPAGISIHAGDGKGNDLAASVFVDGRKLGAAPDTFTVPVCSKELVVRAEGAGEVRQQLALEEKTIKEIRVTLKSTAAAPEAHVAAPAKPAKKVESPFVKPQPAAPLSGKEPAAGGGSMWLWIGAGASVAAGATLAFVGAAQTQEANDVYSAAKANSHPDFNPLAQSVIDTYDADHAAGSNVAWLGYGLVGVGAGLGVWALLRGSAEADVAASHWRATPWLGPVSEGTAGGFALSGRF